MLEILIASLVALSVFFHGQFDTQPYKAIVRNLSLAIVVAAMGSIAHAQWGLIVGVMAATSTASAFTWGPEIGWNHEVARTQVAKGLWLALPLLPIGLIYGAARPAAYYVGYTHFAKYPDEIARAISGFALGVCVYISLGLLNARSI